MSAAGAAAAHSQGVAYRGDDFRRGGELADAGRGDPLKAVVVHLPAVLPARSGTCPSCTRSSSSRHTRTHRLGSPRVFVNGEEAGRASASVPVIDFETAFRIIKKTARRRCGLAARATLRVFVTMLEPLILNDFLMPRVQLKQVNYAIPVAGGGEPGPPPFQLRGRARERLHPRQPEHVQRGELRVRSGTGGGRADEKATGTGAAVAHQQQRAPSIRIAAGPQTSRPRPRRLLTRYRSEGPVMAVRAADLDRWGKPGTGR